MWTAIISSLSQHRLGWFTGFSAFIISLWSGLVDGKGLVRSILGGLICVVVAIAIVAVMKTSGLHGNWLPIIGVFVGFVGAERIRDAILGAWENRKNSLVNRNGDNEQK